MASNVITPALLSAIFQSYSFVFNDALKGIEPTWTKVAMEVSSSASANNYAWLGQMPRIREWVGERVINSLDSFGYQIRNKTFEDTVAVKREQIEDDQYGLFKPMFAEMGRAVKLFPDELVYGLLKTGHTAPCFDGQNFFDTDHPIKDAKGDVTIFASNYQAGAAGYTWYLLDTTRAVKPMIFQNRRPFQFISKTDPNQSDRVFLQKEFIYGVDGRCNAGFGLWQLAFMSTAPLNRANFRAARAAMRALTADYGRPLGIEPNLLVVGTNQKDLANDLIKAKFLPTDGSPGMQVPAPGVPSVIDNTDMNSIEVFATPWLN
jgi:phage major head subunit gpT-like protein